MKKLNGAVTAVIAAAFAFGAASCKTTKVVPDSTAKAEVGAEDEIDKITIVDWTDRALGEVASPQWLVNMRKGNSDTFKSEWKIDSNRVVKISYAVGKTEATAQAFSRAGFAYAQAAELNQKVIGRVGQGLNDVGQLEAVFVAASETKADMTGLREEHSFWQKVRKTNAATKERSEEYGYYTVYSMSKETWDNLCKKYLMDIMGGADLTTETQKKVGALFTEMKEDADKKDAAKQAEEERLYKQQMARIEAERAKSIADAAASKAEAVREAVGREAQIRKAVEDAAYLESLLN